MGFTFIAVENPLSKLGNKKLNYPLTPKSKPSTKLERTKAKEKEKSDDKKWEEREKLLSNKEISLEKDTARENEHGARAGFREEAFQQDMHGGRGFARLALQAASFLQREGWYQI